MQAVDNNWIGNQIGPPTNSRYERQTGSLPAPGIRGWEWIGEWTEEGIGIDGHDHGHGTV
ncbi:hypothetical protein N7508_006874 [Penicillium antarcticum]|uniref:uncharacterized protein n=1 Tax=Penicillium antarcticum TaxID=416450 RepID=UPI0023A4E766|nr:uncharacterized protein N7508_006874 [Penicillium antarcticum]KAJ5302011.1 hypothetical protein N7508_006874 [Penicillium antarcticum]